METLSVISTFEQYSVPSLINLGPITHIRVYLNGQIVGITSDGIRFSPREAVPAFAIQARFDVMSSWLDDRTFITPNAVISPGVIGQFPDNISVSGSSYSFSLHLSQIWEPLHDGNDPINQTPDSFLLTSPEFRDRMVQEGATVLLEAINGIESQAAPSRFEDIHKMITALERSLSRKGKEELRAGLADIGISRYLSPASESEGTEILESTDGELIRRGIRYVVQIVRSEILEHYHGEFTSPLIINLTRCLFDQDYQTVHETRNAKRMLRGLHRIGVAQFLFD